MVAANFNFFSGLSCKIHFENLDEFIEEFGVLSADNLNYRLEKFLLRHDSSNKFDIILAWDLLNYLPLTAVGQLFTLLNDYCHPNTLMHSVKYLNSNIPEKPARFEIVDKYHMQIGARALAPRKIAAHQTAALLKQIPQYYLHNNLMNESGMASGIAEHVMRFMPDKSVRKQQVASAEIYRPDFNPQERPATSKKPRIGTAKNKKAPVSDGKVSPFSESHYQSPTIQHLLNGEFRKRTLLDLGLKSMHNLDTWRQFFHRVYAEDLPASLHWRNYANEAIRTVSAVPVSNEALQFEPGLTFDVITLWDCFNYCSPDQIAAIGNKLSRHCLPGTQILVMSYSGAEIPAQPQRYRLANDGYHCLSQARKAPRPANSVTTASIMKLIPGWIIKKTSVFSPGMKPGVAELLFEQI